MHISTLDMSNENYHSLHWHCAMQCSVHTVALAYIRYNEQYTFEDVLTFLHSFMLLFILLLLSRNKSFSIKSNQIKFSYLLYTMTQNDWGRGGGG